MSKHTLTSCSTEVRNFVSKQQISAIPFQTKLSKSGADRGKLRREQYSACPT